MTTEWTTVDDYHALAMVDLHDVNGIPILTISGGHYPSAVHSDGRSTRDEPHVTITVYETKITRDGVTTTQPTSIDVCAVGHYVHGRRRALSVWKHRGAESREEMLVLATHHIAAAIDLMEKIDGVYEKAATVIERAAGEPLSRDDYEEAASVHGVETRSDDDLLRTDSGFSITVAFPEYSVDKVVRARLADRRIRAIEEEEVVSTSQMPLQLSAHARDAATRQCGSRVLVRLCALDTKMITKGMNITETTMNPATIARDSLLANVNEAFARYDKTGKARDRDAAKKLAATLAAMTPVDLDLAGYDFWAINSSAGKDSQAALDFMVEHADAIDFPRDRIVVLHADLGRVEWAGTRELAEEQARHYGLAFVATKARTKDGTERDLLDQIRDRGMWPSNSARYCTSDQKRGPCRREITALAKSHDAYLARPIRVLSVMGIRADESPARSKVAPIVPAFVAGKAQAGSSGRKHVVTLFPIYNWTEAEVWARIKASGVPSHPAYELGMPRLSCVFCVFAPKPALMLAGKHNPDLLDCYVEVENEIDHTFRKDFKIAEVKAELEAGAEADAAELVKVGGAWNM